MKTKSTLEEILLSLSQETEQRLSAELDTFATPDHHFSRKYQKKKRKILKEYKHQEPVLQELEYLPQSLHS